MVNMTPLASCGERSSHLLNADSVLTASVMLVSPQTAPEDGDWREGTELERLRNVSEDT